ncbi:MAG: hypothetical protein EOM05_06495 [Clostridia bacterium]|nr:hypothetical protein [Clostridia bacterium]
MDISSLLYENAKNFGDQIAFFEGNKKYTYKEIAQMTKYAQRVLSESGVKKHSNIILLEPISVRMYVALMAIWSLGASVIVFDPTATDDYIEKCLTRVKPDFFIGCRKSFLLKLKLSALRKVEHSFTTGKMFSKKAFDDTNIDYISENTGEDLPALITFTSGSTGIPKVAVRTQNFLFTQYKIIDKTMAYSDGDIDIAVLPVFTIANIAKGIGTVIPHKSLSKITTKDPQKIIEQIQNFEITRITASPAIVSRLADYLFETGQKAPSITRLNVGGGPIFPYMMKNVKTAFPNAKLLLVYGSTEAEPIAEVEYDRLTKVQFDLISNGAGLIGGYVVEDIKCKVIKNLPDESIGKITEEEFANMVLAHDVGEIVVSGDHVLQGYLDGIGDDENKFDVESVRWHRTGDLGYFDDNGMLWLMGRASAVISDDRGVLYPFAIESAVSTKLGIKHSTVTMFNEKRILVTECTNAQLPSLEKFKDEVGIDIVLQIDKMPMDIRHHSKVDYNILKEFVEKAMKSS